MHYTRPVKTRMRTMSKIRPRPIIIKRTLIATRAVMEEGFFLMELGDARARHAFFDID